MKNSSAIEQLNLLGYKPGDQVYFRAIRDKAIKFQTVYPDIPEDLARLNEDGFGIYVVVNGGGHKDGDVSSCKAVFIEWDDKPKEEQTYLWQELGLPIPSIQIDTGGKSVHSYWVFNEAIKVEDWKKLQAELLQYGKADRSIKNPSRVMRVAGFKHQKTGEMSEIISASDTTYSFEFLRQCVPKKIDPVTEQPTYPLESKPKPIQGEEYYLPPVPIERCLSRQNRDNLNGVSQGSRNESAFHLACDLLGVESVVPDLDFDYIGRFYQIGVDGDPQTILNDFGSRCSPPLNSKELENIWKSAQNRHPQPALDQESLKQCLRKWAKETISNKQEHRNTSKSEKTKQNRRRMTFEQWLSIPNDQKDSVPSELVVAAKVVSDLFKDRLVFDSETKQWWRYDDCGIWFPASDEYIFAQVQKYLSNILEPFTYSVHYLQSVIRFARSFVLEEGWSEPSSFDYLPFQNGILDLKTLELLPHSPLYKFTWQLPRNYVVKTANFHNINKFLWELSDRRESLRNILIAYLNAILKGRSDLQRFMYLFGSGANGKGAFMHLCRMLIGAQNCHASNMQELNGNRFEPANLKGKRLLLMTDEDRRSGGFGVFKAATGEDVLRCERKGKDSTNFIFRGMTIVAANLPTFAGDSDYAIKRRKISFPCTARIAEENRRDLTPDFEADLEAFTTYLLNLPDTWVTNTIRSSRLDPAIAKLEWELSQRENSIAAYVADCLIPDPNAECFSSHIYKSYQQYCNEGTLKPKSIKNFMPGLLELCNESMQLGHIITKNHTKFGNVLRGIRIRTDADLGISPDDVYTPSGGCGEGKVKAGEGKVKAGEGKVNSQDCFVEPKVKAVKDKTKNGDVEKILNTDLEDQYIEKKENVETYKENKNDPSPFTNSSILTSSNGSSLHSTLHPPFTSLHPAFTHPSPSPSKNSEGMALGGDLSLHPDGEGTVESILHPDRRFCVGVRVVYVGGMVKLQGKRGKVTKILADNRVLTDFDTLSIPCDELELLVTG